MTGVVQGVIGKMRYLVGLQDGGEKQILSRSLTIVAVRSELEEEIEVSEVEMIPDIGQKLGCYHLVYVSQHFIKEYGLNTREEQVIVNPDPDQEEIKDVVLDDEKFAIGAWFLKTTMERWMGRSIFYIQEGGMYKNWTGRRW